MYLKPAAAMVFKLAAMMVVVLSLAACEGVAWVEGVSLITTEKAASDHIVSFYRGKNCSISRTNKGQTYCEEDERNPTAQVHCYRTLGEVTCYREKNPHGDNRQEVGLNDHNVDTAR